MKATFFRYVGLILMLTMLFALLAMPVSAVENFLSGDNVPCAQSGECCSTPDNGTGTADLPPESCPYVASPGQLMVIEDFAQPGPPPGTTIEITPTLHSYTNIVEVPGGGLGGHVQTFNAVLTMDMVGTGSLVGFFHTVDLPVAVEMHSGPRTSGDPVQSFDIDVFSLSGPPYTDPNFIMLAISAVAPNPGQTTLTKLPSGDFAVDSFFDITYTFAFIGNGPSLGGLSNPVPGATGTMRMEIEGCKAPVGGYTEPTSAKLFAPWIALAVVGTLGAIAVMRKRRLA